MESAAKVRKLAAAKKSGKDAKAKAKVRKLAAAKKKGEAPAAAAKVNSWSNGEGPPAIYVENSRSQIKAWTGRKGENMNRVVSFKSTTQMKARKIAFDWLVARCKVLRIDVPAKVK